MSGGPHHGTVVWIDLSTSDVDGAMRFYGELLGWQFEVTESAQGKYVIARVGGRAAGGMMAPDGATRQSPWGVIIAVDDLDASLTRVRELGGTVVEPPAPTPGGSCVALVADSAGAGLALMESPGPRLTLESGEPGAIGWVECLTRDAAGSRSFLEQLFGWKAEDGPGGYVVFSRDGRPVAGLMSMPPSVPPEVPSSWLVYFSADVDAVCARIGGLGGRVNLPPQAIPQGRFAVLADPHGATFAVIERS